MPAVEQTSIPGLLHVELDVLENPQGWFKESFQQAKLTELGFPKVEFVQNNVAYTTEIGITRGVHAEPWDRYISPALGRLFTAIVDLREGPAFGRLETFELTPGQAIFLPEGCGHAFCTLEPNTVYTYLLTQHWTPEARRTVLNLFDPQVAVPWPLPRGELQYTEVDATAPYLDAVTPIRV
ncbi:dTDP-4-dehydrorhamnose 3,5-epimerase family protein [Kribbella sp. NPDC023855]|uniref:dTDP-4-dehydrorhamnose 3,5-epimerase family protein n=1 Tax=Kribbella sp. NPDC023855 TaxID=3154698 RepID=UPI0033CEC8E4